MRWEWDFKEVSGHVALRSVVGKSTSSWLNELLGEATGVSLGKLYSFP